MFGAFGISGMYSISVVSYLNSLPFVYGLEHYMPKGTISLHKDTPSVCSQKLLSGEADIGLIPSRSIADLGSYEIISDYCIGAMGHVGSVSLLSSVAVNKLEEIYIDQDSKTSVALSRLLMKKWWNIKPRLVLMNDQKELESLNGHSGAVVIGDKVLNHAHRFKYNYDLSDEWYKMTGLPFVFAVWASKMPIDQKFMRVFNKALQKGLTHREMISVNKKDDFPHTDIQEYLYKKIDYDFDTKKLESLHLFLGMIDDPMLYD